MSSGCWSRSLKQLHELGRCVTCPPVWKLLKYVIEKKETWNNDNAAGACPLKKALHTQVACPSMAARDPKNPTIICIAMISALTLDMPPVHSCTPNDRTDKYVHLVRACPTIPPLRCHPTGQACPCANLHSAHGPRSTAVHRAAAHVRLTATRMCTWTQMHRRLPAQPRMCA